MPTNDLLTKLPGYRTQLEELDQSLSTSEVMGNMKLYKEKMMERSHLAPIVEKLEEMEKLSTELADSEEMLTLEEDGEMREVIKEEIEELKASLEAAEKECKVLLVPPDPLEGKNIIMEIRAGTGGEEAALFAADIFRMYTHYAEKKRWKIEIMSQNETE
ncbi:MAG: PCRF domain-containing protein, partial [Candidatus Ornithospirochaeta sp.]